MNNQLKLLLYIVFVVGIFYMLQNRFEIFDISFKENNIVEEFSEKKEEEVQGETQSYIQIPVDSGFVKVNVEVADSEQERSLGLSGRRYLGDYEGMIFVFEEETATPFWMKDMVISLDMIFIDKDGFVVDLKEDLAPCEENYCTSIYSKEKFMYNLEVNSGFVLKHGIEIGDNIDINLY